MKLLNRILLLLTALALGACSDSASEPDVSPAACTISIVLRDGGMTRADAGQGNGDTWGDQYTESYYFPAETVIDNVQFFVYSTNGTLRPLTSKLIGSVESHMRVYRAEIALDDNLVEHRDGKLYFTGDVIGIVNYRDQIHTPFAANPFRVDRLGAPDIRIPMWGVAHLEGQMLKENEVVLAGDIYMLRAIPRITFQMDERVKSLFRIKNIQAVQTDYPLVANTFPTGGQDVHDTRNLSLEGCYNPNASTGVTGAPVFHQFDDGSTVTWCTYVAERPCGLVDGTPLAFNVTVEEIAEPHRTFTGKVYLCDYANGLPLPSSPYTNLVRNHDYKFIINLTPLDFYVTVEEWKWGGKYNIDFDTP